MIPKIAEVLGITVEELFASKRFEKDSELDKIKTYLLSQKKKNAVASSIFLSAIITLPMLLIEFICVVMGFKLPDDVIGPLGSVGFIFAFIASLVAFIIYRNNFKHTWEPTQMTHTPGFVKAVKVIMLSCAIACWFLFVLLSSVYMLILSFSADTLPANIFLAIAFFILILLIGIIICLANIKRLLKIKFKSHIQGENKRTTFSNLPVWCKICCILAIVLFPIVIKTQIWGFLSDSWLFINIKSTSLVTWFSCVLALIIYNSVKKK